MIAQAKRPSESIHARILASPLILVIDDDAVIRDSLTCYLMAAGYSVITARNGEEGVKRYVLEAPDAVLVDVLMPEKDGIETILHLRKLRPNARIIAMSGGGQIQGIDYLDMAVKLGANLGLAKPIDVARLVTGLRALIYPPAPGIAARRADRPFRQWAEVRAHAALETARRCITAKAMR